MSTFAISIHPETLQTSRPVDDEAFRGFSLPYAMQLRSKLADALRGYPSLPLRSADFALFADVHTATYLAQIQELAADRVPDPYPQLSIECSRLWYALPGYCFTLGGMLSALEAMRAGSLDRAFCAGRAGHHAYPGRGHGYSLLNPLAAAVRSAQRMGFERVLIVDWDIHHGDGTQAIFADDPSVFQISIHSAADLYMATMRVLPAGTTTAAAAVGHCNIPLLLDRFDAEDWAAFGLGGEFYRGHESIPMLAEALQALPWTPDLICIFAGVDSHRDDCGGGITNWTNDDFQSLTRLVLAAARSASCPVLSVQGGGYKLPITVAALTSHVAALAAG